MMSRSKSIFKNNIVQALVFFIPVLATVGFLNPFGITSSNSRFALQLFDVITILWLLICCFSKERITKKYFPIIPFILLLTSYAISVQMAYTHHSQSYRDSFFASFPTLAGYLFFLIFTKLPIDKGKLFHYIRVLLVLSIFVYFTNRLTFDDTVFKVGRVDTADESERGIRLWIPFLDLHIMYLYYSISRWTEIHKGKHLFWIILTSIMIVLSLTRQTIFLSAIFSVLLLLRKSNWKNKFLSLVFIIAFYFIVMPQISIFQDLLRISQEQSDRQSSGKDDVRLEAWGLYTVGLQDDTETMIFGNGYPSWGNSEWGKYVASVSDYGHWYYVDVGWAGYYFFFGFYGVITLIVLVLYSIKKRRNKKNLYLCYILLHELLTSFASAPILYSDQTFMIGLFLYMLWNYDKESENLDMIGIRNAIR